LITIKTTVDLFFSLSLFLNAMLFVPQAIRLFRLKDSKDISLITFVGFCLIQLSAILYGAVNHDYIIFLGYTLSLITCGSVTVLSIYFRKKYRFIEKGTM